MRINDCVQICHENAVSKGFYEDIKAIETLHKNCVIDEKFYKAMIYNAIVKNIALAQGEGFEAIQAMRNEEASNFEEEISDSVMRLFDLSGYLNIDLEAMIKEKMEKNKTRPYKHNKAF